MQKKILFILIFLISFSARSQQLFELGGEMLKSYGKGYGTTKVAARGENFNNKNSFSVGITWQLASKKAYSVSTGFGIFAGYRRAFGNNIKGSNPFGGGRLLISLEDFEGKTEKHHDYPDAGSRLSFCFWQTDFHFPGCWLRLYHRNEPGL